MITFLDVLGFAEGGLLAIGIFYWAKIIDYYYRHKYE